MTAAWANGASRAAASAAIAAGRDASAVTAITVSQRHSRAGDGGHDVDRFPSYGPAWRALDPRWGRRLEQLGVPALAAAEEAFSRARRPPR